MIDISSIKLDPQQKQPRKTFNQSSLLELSKSIKEKGVLQPILVRRKDDSAGYFLISGERRLRACKLSNLENIPAIVLKLEDQEAWEVGIIENLQRENLNPIDEAEAFEHLIKKHNYSKELLADKLSKSISYISNSLNLNKLPNSIKEQLKENKLTQGHARPLLRLNKEDAEQISLKIINNNLSVRDTENLVNKIIKSGLKEENGNTKKHLFHDEIQNIEEKLEKKLNAKVKIKISNKTKKTTGKFEIRFKSLEDFERIVSKLASSK